ncbi:hypothetical protein GS444_23735 [Rhodococcus hoagii]|nr:hypothetical protein [Prescottella equi]
MVTELQRQITAPPGMPAGARSPLPRRRARQQRHPVLRHRQFRVEQLVTVPTVSGQPSRTAPAIRPSATTNWRSARGPGRRR